MEIPVYRQLVEVLSALALGFAAGVFYDLLRVVRGRLPFRFVTAICDFVFCIAAGCSLFALGMTIGGGRQRAVLAVLSVLGGALYFLTMTRPARYILEGTADLVTLLLWILTFPTAFLIKTLKKIAVFSKKVFNYGLGWYIFRERRALQGGLRRRTMNSQRSGIREKSGTDRKNSRVRDDRLSRVEDPRSSGRYKSGGSKARRASDTGGGA